MRLFFKSPPLKHNISLSRTTIITVHSIGARKKLVRWAHVTEDTWLVEHFPMAWWHRDFLQACDIQCTGGGMRGRRRGKPRGQSDSEDSQGGECFLPPGPVRPPYLCCLP